nr:DUF4468 domain-containing protein [uncultured Flavobacterium sp.]
MKKIILFVLLGISNIIYSQKIIVTPNGLRNSEDNEKSFVVIPVDGKNAKQIYDDMVKYINKTYKGGEEVITGKTDGEYLKFKTFVPNFASLKNGMKIYFKANYTTELSFKDGKIKYEIIDIKMTNDSNYELYFTGSGFSFYIYDKNGKLKREETKIEIEKYFNENISSISNFLNSKVIEDKW